MPIDCYFLRARQFAPDDATVLVISGTYRWKVGNKEAALVDYESAIEIEPDHLDAHYNLGLLYLEMGDRKQAQEHAAVAYAGGYPLQGLRRQLAKVGLQVPSHPQSEIQP